MLARYVEMHSPQSFSSSSGKACAQSPHCRGLGSIPTQAHPPLAVTVSLQGPEWGQRKNLPIKGDKSKDVDSVLKAGQDRCFSFHAESDRMKRALAHFCFFAWNHIIEDLAKSSIQMLHCPKFKLVFCVLLRADYVHCRFARLNHLSHRLKMAKWFERNVFVLPPCMWCVPVATGKRRNLSPTTLRPWVLPQTAVTYTRWWRCERSSGRSSWRWGEQLWNWEKRTHAHNKTPS